VIAALAGFGLNALVVVASGLALILILRFGGAVLDALPMSRARRTFVVRFKPAVGALLVVAYLLLTARWLLRHDERLAPYVLSFMTIVVVVASWGALRDILEGVYHRAARSCSVGDRVQVGTIRGRIQRMGLRNVYLEGSEGDLAIVPYRVLSTHPILRSSEAERSTFHVFRVPVPSSVKIPDARRTIRERALLCHWSSIARPPQVVAAGPDELEITVFAIDGDRAPEIERAVREALAQDSNSRTGSA